jgi:hypothetical protein
MWPLDDSLARHLTGMMSVCNLNTISSGDSLGPPVSQIAD